MSFLGSFGTFLSLLFVAVAVFFALPPRKVDLVNLDKCVSRRGYYGVEDLQVIPGQPVVLGTSDTKEYHFVQGWISELTDNPRGVRRNHGVAATRGHIVAFNVKDLISQDKYLADVGVIMPGVRIYFMRNTFIHIFFFCARIFLLCVNYKEILLHFSFFLYTI